MSSVRKISIMLVVALSLMFGLNNVALATNNLPSNAIGIEQKASIGKVSNFKIVSISSNSVKLSWQKASGATKYVLYRSNTKSGGYKSIKSLSKSSTSYVDVNLRPSTTYYYKLVPYAGSTRGPSTSVLSARTESQPTPVEKPQISIYMSSITDTNTLFVLLYVTNRGSSNLTIKTTNAMLIDDDYSYYNRIMGLINVDTGQFINSQVIAPGEEVMIGFKVVSPASRTWYDRYSRLYFDFEYTGKKYQCSASSYYGSFYSSY